MKMKTQIMDELAVRRAMTRISYEIIERCLLYTSDAADE